MSERELVLRYIEKKNNTRLDKAEAQLENTEDTARREKLENDIRLLRETIVTLDKRALALTPAQGNGSYVILFEEIFILFLLFPILIIF